MPHRSGKRNQVSVNVNLPLRQGGRDAGPSFAPERSGNGRKSPLAWDLLSCASPDAMNYRKIGQRLQPNAEQGSGAVIAPNLRAKPLAELGLTGLIERLAMAIRESEARQ